MFPYFVRPDDLDLNEYATHCDCDHASAETAEDALGVEAFGAVAIDTTKFC